MAATYCGKEHFFGRNLDYDMSYGQRVVVTPRNHVFRFRNGIIDRGHYAMIGMAAVSDSYPLYFDATNEKGLSIAGLNFPHYAHYGKNVSGKDNIASFEFIPWVLGRCKDLDEARELISGTNITDTAFSSSMRPSPMHWMVSDRSGSLVIEPRVTGLKIHDNPVGVMTNSPPFPYHMLYLADHMGLTSDVLENRMCPDIELRKYSRGMGAIGLPGDLSSTSRFVRAAFTRLNSKTPNMGDGELTQFFHIMDSVQQQYGCCGLENGKYEYTIYTSCCNTDRGIYYYRTYGNSQISGVDMHHVNLDGENLYQFPVVEGQHILMQN